MIEPTIATYNARRTSSALARAPRAVASASATLLLCLTIACARGDSSWEQTAIVARVPLASDARLGAGSIVEIPGEALGHRALELGSSSRDSSELRLLVGGDGVRSGGNGDAASGLLSRVTPLVLGERVIGYLWRARANRADVTLPIAVNHADVPDANDPFVLVYLDAEPLSDRAEITRRLDAATELLLLEPERGAVITVTPEPGLLVDAMLFGEIDGDTWTRRDYSTTWGGESSRLRAPSDRASALVLRRLRGGGIVEIDASAARSARPTTRDDIWRVVVADDGESDSYWGMISSPAHVLAKELRLDVDPGTLSEARVVYSIGYDAFHSKSRSTTPGPDATWSDLVIGVNGRTVARHPLPDAGLAGWHRVQVPVEALVRGENRVTFRLDGPDYIYFSVDTDTHLGRSGVVENGRMNTATLRPDRDVTGEYLVRLEHR